MAVSGCLQASLDLGIYRRSHGRSSRRFRVQNVKSSVKLRLLSATLPSISAQEYSWSSSISKRIRRRVCTIPCAANGQFSRCHCFFNPGGDASSLKDATFALARSLQGRPVLLKLTSAVGIGLFAIWGLQPLVRLTRNIFLHKTDNSWKKSSTFHVTTSYVQPLLLWAGAILICRALDPMILPTEAGQIVKQRLLNFVRSLSTVLAFAYCLSSVIQQAQKFMMETNDPNDSRNMGFQFAGRALYTAVWVAAASLFVELLGFSTQKWLTAGGLGTVLLTLAGREIFTNFLSSAMIHATRPFVVNEWIQTKIEGYEVSGTVEHVGWWSPTIVRGEDREAVHIPNHKFTVNVVRNLSQKTHWRIKTHLAISHLDVSKINNIVADMRKVLAKNPQVEQQKLHRRVFLDNINPENQALLILVSCFVKTSHFEEYLCVKETILLDLLRVIRHHRARLATPIRTVQKIFNDADLDNVPFSDSVFNRGAVSNRPFLLIEPSYKINGEDKTKTQARPARASGEDDSKPHSKTAPDSKADAKGETSSTDTRSRETGTADNKTKEIKEMPMSDVKADAEDQQTTSNEKKEDPMLAAKLDDSKLKNSSTKSGSKTDNKPVDGTSSNSSTSSGQTQNNLNGKSPQKVSQENASVSSLELGAKRSDIPSCTKDSKQDSRQQPAQPPVNKPSLEENIVLGVALEGSKRTLPIEEEAAHLPKVEDVKELAAALRSGGGSVVAEKDKNNVNRLNSPGSSPAIDQLDQQE